MQSTLAFNSNHSNFSRLNSSTPLIKAYFQGRNDGMDQVYLKGNNGHNYVLELSSNIEFYQPAVGQAKPMVSFMDGSTPVNASLEYYDNESKSSSITTSPLNTLNPGLGDALDNLMDKARGVISYEYNADHSKIKHLKADKLDIQSFDVLFSQSP